jgi:hypothetical protein
MGCSEWDPSVASVVCGEWGLSVASVVCGEWGPSVVSVVCGKWGPSAASVAIQRVLDPYTDWLTLTCYCHFVRLDPICTITYPLDPIYKELGCTDTATQRACLAGKSTEEIIKASTGSLMPKTGGTSLPHPTADMVELTGEGSNDSDSSNTNSIRLLIWWS